MTSLTWVYGDDVFRVGEFVRSLQHRFAVDVVDRMPDGVDNDTLAQSILGVSLLGGRKLIVAKDPACLTQASNPESVRFLESTASSVPPGHFLVFISTKSVDGRTKAAQFLKKRAETHEFATFKEWELGKAREWLMAQAKARGIGIASDAVDLILDTVGFETGVLDQLLGTLRVYAGGVSRLDVAMVTSVLGTRSGSIFRLTEALRVNLKVQVVTELVALDEDGEEPVKILGIVASTLHQCLVTLEMMGQGRSFQDIGSVLERHPYSIQKTAPELKRAHSVSGLLEMLARLHEIDLAFKSGELSESGMVPLIAAAVR